MKRDDVKLFYEDLAPPLPLRRQLTARSPMDFLHAEPPRPLKVSTSSLSQPFASRNMNLNELAAILDDPELSKWKEVIRIETIPRERVEIIVYTYEKEKNGAWVVLARDKAELNDLMLELRKISGSLETPTEEQVYVGALLAVKYNDSVFCRGIVKASKDGMYEVFLIDYGSSKNVTRNDLRLPSKDMQKKAAYGIFVRFSSEKRNYVMFQRLTVDIVNVVQGVPVVKESSVSLKGIVESFICDGVKEFEANLAAVFDLAWYTVRIVVPKTMPHLNSKCFEVRKRKI